MARLQRRCAPAHSMCHTEWLLVSQDSRRTPLFVPRSRLLGCGGRRDPVLHALTAVCVPMPTIRACWRQMEAQEQQRILEEQQRQHLEQLRLQREREELEFFDNIQREYVRSSPCHLHPVAPKRPPYLHLLSLTRSLLVLHLCLCAYAPPCPLHDLCATSPRPLPRAVRAGAGSKGARRAPAATAHAGATAPASAPRAAEAAGASSLATAARCPGLLHVSSKTFDATPSCAQPPLTAAFSESSQNRKSRPES